MLLRYKFKNFRSYKEEVEFSMEASKTRVKRRFCDNYVSMPSGHDILKSAVVVGENAGGKTNFVVSMMYLKEMFSINQRIYAIPTEINVNNIDNEDTKSDNCQMFEIEVVIGGDEYAYHLEVDFYGIIREYLQIKKRGTSRILMVLNAKRTGISEKENGDKRHKLQALYKLDFIGEDDYSDRAIEKLKNEFAVGLFINKLAMLGNEYATIFSEWIQKSLLPESARFNMGLMKAYRHEEEDVRILSDPRFLEIFKMIDPSIKEIVLDKEKPYQKTDLIRTDKRGETFHRKIESDSSGVEEYFAWAVQIFKVVYENKCVVADEIDRVLNPILADKIISFINGKEHTGQFIFTTHNVLHLDLKKYMKEQIYFATKDTDTLESELYSLADFPEVRYETTKIYEFYMKGVLGGTVNE